jgi:hypothetical protein
MSAEQRETEPLYNAQGQRLCGALRPNGKRCERIPDRGLTRCYRHAQPRGEDGKAPKRGKQWTDGRGVDTSYIDKLGLSFDPQAADLQFEIELINRDIHATTKALEDAMRDLRAGRKGPNPAALRAERTNLIATKTKLVAAQTNRLKSSRSYLTRAEIEVFTRLVIYCISRLGLTTEQQDAFTADMRVVIAAPWKLTELPARKAGGDYMARAKALYAELWAEKYEGTNPPAEIAPADDEDEPGLGETEEES